MRRQASPLAYTAPQSLFRMSLCSSLHDDGSHFEFEWIAVADLVDLDHSGLRHYRFVYRASCRLDRRTTLPRQVESGSPSVVPPALHHRVMSGSLQAISKSQATRDCFAR